MRESGDLFRPLGLSLAALVLFCAAVSLWLGSRVTFEAGGLPVHRLFLGLYDTLELTDLRRRLTAAAPETRDLVFWIFAGPDLVLPPALAALGWMLLRKLATGADLFGKPVSPLVFRALLALPVLYGLCDYAENLMSILYLTPATPSPSMLTSAPGLLPQLTHLKMVLATVSALVIVRFILVRHGPVARPPSA